MLQAVSHHYLHAAISCTIEKGLVYVILAQPVLRYMWRGPSCQKSPPYAPMESELIQTLPMAQLSLAVEPVCLHHRHNHCSCGVLVVTHVTAGHSCWGILHAPATGEAIAAMICDASPPVDMSEFDPARFATSRRYRMRTWA